MGQYIQQLMSANHYSYAARNLLLAWRPLNEQVAGPEGGEKGVGLRMSAKSIPESGRENLRSAMGDAIRFDSDEIILQREATPETHEQRQQQDIETSVRERSRDFFQAADAEFERLRRDDDGTEVGFRSEADVAIARIYLAQICAVAVGRKRLFHDTMPAGC